MNNTRNISLAIGIICILSGVIMLRKKTSLKNLLASGDEFYCKSSNYPLQYGTCHPDVKIVQRYLKHKGANLGSYGNNKEGIDGRFGKMTLASAKALLGKTSFSKTDIQRMLHE